MLRTSAPRQARQSTVLPSPLCRLRLRIRLANGKKKTVATSAAKNTIGSHPSCDIRIPGPSEVGVQCLLMRSRGKVVVRNWDDSVTLNGRKFQIALLTPSDSLRFSGCTLRLLKSGKRKGKSKSSSSSGARFGKRLVGEIGKRLAHLESRLVTRQRRLTRQLESTTAQNWPSAVASINPAGSVSEPTASNTVPPPLVVEGLNTLRSAVEELRARVEDVAVRPWPTVEVPTPLDTEALLHSATSKMGEIVQQSLREDRTLSALKFEQISRDFDRISQRLGDVEEKLNLPTTEMLTEQVRPVSEAVEFVRAGLQLIEDRQATDAARFDKLAGSLDALRQSTIERLGAMAEKVNGFPSLTKVEREIASVSEQLQGLTRDFAQRQDLYFTRSDAATLVEEVGASAIAREALQLRLTEMGEHFHGMHSEWTQFKLGAAEQIQALSSKIDSLPLHISPASNETINFSQFEGKLEGRLAEMGEQFTSLRGEWTQFQSGQIDQLQAISSKINSLPTDHSPVQVIDISPLEQKLTEHDAQLADQSRVLSECFATQQQITSKLSTTDSLIEELRSETHLAKLQGQQIEQLSGATAEARDLAEEAIAQAKSSQKSLLEQLIALECRCVSLESQLVRLAQRAPVNESDLDIPIRNGASVAAMPQTSEVSVNYASSVDSAECSLGTYGAESDEVAQETGAPPFEAEAQSTEEEPFPEQVNSTPSNIFGAFERSALTARTASEEAQLLSETSETSEVQAETKPVAPVPNSVLDSLRLSGIWKGDNDQEEIDPPAESMDDPRDIVGSSYEAEAASVPPIDHGIHVKEQPKQSAWASPHPAPSAENEEESIDAYMERLLQRVAGAGGGGEVTGAMAVAEHLQRAKAEAAKRRDSRPEHTDGEFEYTPKGPAPEKNADLSALRELAMTSANANIQNYQKANKAKTANEKWLVVIVAMTCAMGLLYVCVNHKSDWTFFGAGAAFIVALYWAIQASLTTVAAKRPLKSDSDFEAKLKQAPETSSVEAKRRKSDNNGPIHLDQPSAGETFQSLLAERERMNGEAE